MTAHGSAAQQAQLLTEEWMTMSPPSSSSSSKVVPPTFLEIMFLRETEDYVYTNVLPTLMTELHAKYIRPFAHKILMLLQQHQRRLNQVEESNDANEWNESTRQSHAALFGKMVRQRIHRLKTLVQHYVHQYVLPILIRFVTRMNTVINTNRNYRLEIIYVLRYILDRYTLIQYSCTLVEMLYGGGTMIRKKIRMVSPPQGSQIQGHHYQSASSATQLLPLNKNDQIRTALLTTVLGYVYEKAKQLYSHPSHGQSINRSNSITKKLLQLYVSMYQIGNQIYYPYQYLIGTSYYMNLPNRLLRQILLLQQRQQHQPLPTTATTTSRIASSTGVSSTLWYVTMLRTSGILLLTGCYMTQMIQYYMQRRRTIRQEQLLERQQQQQQPAPFGRPNHFISVTTTGNANDSHTNRHEQRNDGHDGDAPYHDETTLSLLQQQQQQQQQRLLLSSLEAEILPVPLLPKNDIPIPNGCCPICQQPIHRVTTAAPLSNHNSVIAKTDSLAANTTMLYGYVYCSYTCIYQYLMEHDGICPMTGKSVPIMTDRSPPQLIRLL